MQFSIRFVPFVLSTSNRCISTFKYSDLVVVESQNRTLNPNFDKLLFGKQFTDHMLTVEWSLKNGWGKPAIKPYHNLSINPAAKTFHYAAGIFEGIKAMKGVDKKIRIFRPDLNMARMNLSATRATLPNFDNNELLKCIKKLILMDIQWIPEGEGKALYIRPCMIGTEPTLGVEASGSALLFTLLSPVSSYFPTGSNAVSLYADPNYTRASPGGSGNTKMSANYAPTTYVQKLALKSGCQQVLWLYGPKQLLTEVGTMNLFIHWTNQQGVSELVTPPLSGLILAGVTRQCFLELAKSWTDITVHEREISMLEVQEAIAEGRLHEAFGTGTACVVSPIQEIVYAGKKLAIPVPDVTVSISNRFRQQLSDIQYGRISPHKWTFPVDEGI